MKGQTWMGLLALLADERVAADLETRRITDSVNLIKALGGGWLFAELPPPARSSEGKPPYPRAGRLRSVRRTKSGNQSD